MYVFSAFNIANIVNAMKMSNESFFHKGKEYVRRFCKSKVNLLLSPEVYKVGSHTVLLTASVYVVSFR
jgi:hypothetical protein